MPRLLKSTKVRFDVSTCVLLKERGGKLEQRGAGELLGAGRQGRNRKEERE